MTASLFLGLFFLLLLAIHLASIAMAMLRLRPRARRPHARPGVTIIRPVCGLEPFIEQTMTAGFLLDHPVYELLFCVERADDPVVPLVQRLMAAHPAIDARLLIGDERVNANPKLNNCIKGWDAARHGWVILADSNVLMPPDYIAQMLGCWRADSGLVCSPPMGSDAGNLGAEVECAFLNTHQARWQYAAEYAGLGFAQGKSMLWNRAFLDERGGLRALAAEIAEDAAATKLVRAAGLHVHLVDAPFRQPLGPRRLRQVWDRQLRWARLRRVTFPLFFLPEILGGALVPLLTGLALAATSGIGLLPAGIGVLALWYGAEWLLATRHGWPVSWRFLPGCLLRDAMFAAIWFAAWTTGRTVWRGNAMKIRFSDPAIGSGEAERS